MLLKLAVRLFSVLILSYIYVFLFNEKDYYYYYIIQNVPDKKETIIS